MMRRLTSGFAFFIVLFCGMQSHAQEANGLTLQELSLLFNKYGVEAEVQDDLIRGNTEGVAFFVNGFNCAEEQHCTEFTLFVGFDMDAPLSLERINEWNYTMNAGRASLDGEGDPYIDHSFSVSGPTDEGAIYETITLWQAVVVGFMVYIGWDNASV